MSFFKFVSRLFPNGHLFFDYDAVKMVEIGR